MSGFGEQKRTLGFKIETTPYTAETLTASNYDVRAYNIEYTYDVPPYLRKLARGDYSRDATIMGRRSLRITFSVDLHQADTVTSAPSYFKCLQACGMKQYTGGSGVWLKPDADYSNVPATIEAVERDEGASPVQSVNKAFGAMGNARIGYDTIGTPVRIDFEFLGVAANPADRTFATLLTPTNMGTVLPEAVLGVTTTWNSSSLKSSKLAIDLGNDIQLWSDPSKDQGWEGARIVDRNPTLEIDPDMQLIASNNLWGSMTSNTLAAFAFRTNKFQVNAPKAQLEAPPNPQSREGHVAANIKFGLKRNLGNDELEIIQGLNT